MWWIVSNSMDHQVDRQVLYWNYYLEETSEEKTVDHQLFDGLPYGP